MSVRPLIMTHCAHQTTQGSNSLRAHPRCRRWELPWRGARWHRRCRGLSDHSGVAGWPGVPVRDRRRRRMADGSRDQEAPVADARRGCVVVSACRCRFAAGLTACRSHRHVRCRCCIGGSVCLPSTPVLVAVASGAVGIFLLLPQSPHRRLRRLRRWRAGTAAGTCDQTCYGCRTQMLGST